MKQKLEYQEMEMSRYTQFQRAELISEAKEALQQKDLQLLLTEETCQNLLHRQSFQEQQLEMLKQSSMLQNDEEQRKALGLKLITAEKEAVQLRQQLEEQKERCQSISEATFREIEEEKRKRWDAEEEIGKLQDIVNDLMRPAQEQTLPTATINLLKTPEKRRHSIG